MNKLPKTKKFLISINPDFYYVILENRYARKVE